MINEIAKSVPPPVSTFLLTSEIFVDKIIRHHQLTQTSTIQLVDKLKHGTYQELKEALPAIKLVQVIHVIDEQSVDEAISIAEQVDAILLDSGNPNLRIKVLGGTGRVHNWKLSRKIVESIGIPVFLAGGINAENVKQAIEFVGPFGIDLCSSVRTDGALDKKKLDTFFNALK
jgi:phosphoribosylanthranilate isomerase